MIKKYSKIEAVPNLCAAIIAGGKSKRFGTPKKALAKLAEKRLIDYAVDLANSLSSRVLLSCNDDNICRSVNAIAVPDLQPDCGPIGGIHAVLQAATGDWIAILPCDMPLLPPEVYHILLKYHRKNSPTAAVSHRGTEPLVSIWPKTISESAIWKTVFDSQNYSLHHLLKSLNAAEVFMPEKMPDYHAEYFLNVNDQNDLNELQQIIAKRS